MFGNILPGTYLSFLASTPQQSTPPKTLKHWKRVERDLSCLKSDHVLAENLNIEVNDRDLSKIICSITGPKYSFYANEKSYIAISCLENYPLQVPQIVFIPPYIPKNDYIDQESGRISLRILSYGWNPKITLCDVFHYILSILRSKKMNYLNWKPTEPAIQVETAYEITNGLSGMLRFVVFRLLRVTDERKDLEVRDKDNVVRSVIGMCTESYAWKATTWFFGSRPMDITGEVGREWSLALTVRRTDTVAEVKQLVEDKTGFKAAVQKLTLGRAIKLQNTRTLLYYHIVNGTEISIDVPSLGRRIGIDVVTLVMRSFYLDVFEKEPIKNVKRKIESKTNMPTNGVQLFYKGRQLMDGTLVEEYNIANEATIRVVVSRYSSVKYFDEI